MKTFEKAENELYIATYGLPREGNKEKIWESIRKNKEFLKWAIQITQTKHGEDIVNGLAICDAMLAYYKSVDSKIYQELVNAIYSNEEIARIVLDGYSNGGNSFLLMTLWNRDIKLTEGQKQFAVKEAMNKIGTSLYNQRKQEYSKQLDDNNITDDVTVLLDTDGSVNPIGAKAYNLYFDEVFSSLSSTQAHGYGIYDIRYQILRNPNWSTEEKDELVYYFYDDSETYDEYLEEWEWGIINDPANYKGKTLPQLDITELYEYEYDFLLKFYNDKEITDNIWEEIQFCRHMHEVRPAQYELDSEKEYRKDC